jgi:hypothetical protein
MTVRLNGAASMSIDDIVIDAEFASLMPPLSREEYRALEISLLVEGCREPLLVWQGTNILLDGHNRRELCLKHGIGFRWDFIELASREAARDCIVALQLQRRNLTPEAAAYIRGKRYSNQKKSWGGNRGSAGASGQKDHLKTAQQLARQYQVSEVTIRRDARFANAVDRIVSLCGSGAKPLILSRDTGLKRTTVEWLAALTPEEQQKFIEVLKETGKVPRGTFNPGPPRQDRTTPRARCAGGEIGGTTEPGGSCPGVPAPWGTAGGHKQRQSLATDGTRSIHG